MAKIKSGKHITKREVIIREASVLFRIKGFSSASMRELADALGIEAPSLYNHIGSKSELLQIICFNVANEFTLHLDNTEILPGTSAAKIETIIRFHIFMMQHKFDEVFVANHEWKYMEDPYLSNFLHQRRSYEKRLINLVERGTQLKELKNINSYVAVMTILSAVRGLEFWHRHNKNINSKILEQDIVNHLLKGLIK